MALHVRSWMCETCNTAHDRDLNAAINLALYAGSSPVSACGELFASAGTVPDGLVPTRGLDEAGTRQRSAV
ncbi:zinc ribbon domain-containing protein [Glutamicibacter endophyticus]